MANRNVNCMTSSAMVRELYWGCGGGVMECFTGAVTATVPHRQLHPSCQNESGRGLHDVKMKPCGKAVSNR